MAAQAELDAYALCPCGSGKKLKFCCHDIAPDMLRVLRLVEDGQLKQRPSRGSQSCRQ